MSEFDPAANIIFSEPIYIYDYKSDSWLSKNNISFTYCSISPNLNKDRSILSPISSISALEDIIIFSIKVELNSSIIIETIRHIMPLNHIYEIHHYDYQKFLESHHLKTLKGHTTAPKNIISIIAEDENNENAKFFFEYDLEEKTSEIKLNRGGMKALYIGCNFVLKETKVKWESLIAKLYKEFRYSYYGLLEQMQIRFCKLIIKSFKDILKLLLRISREGEQPTSFHLYSYFAENAIKLENYEDMMDIKQEFLNSVYKTIIGDGLFPIFIDLNTMNDSWFEVKQFVFSKLCCFCLQHEEILPWSTRFHASITILDRYYSYTPNNLINQRNEKDRVLQKDYDYYRIKILDFFPLDDFVAKISSFIYRNFDALIEEIGTTINFVKLLGIYKKPEKRKENKEFELFNENDSKIHLLSSNKQNAKKLLKKPEEYQLWIDYDIYKQKKKIQKYKIYSILIKTINSQSETIINKFSKKNEVLPQSLASDFMTNYMYELLNTKFFDNLCRLIAQTEMQRYDFINQNCQTIVGEIVYDLHEQFKKYIDILLPQKKNNFIEKEEQFLKFHSKITNSEYFKKFTKIEPSFFTARLDFYGIYVDTYLKWKIEKSMKEGKNNKSKISKKIQKLQEDLITEYSNNLNSLFSQESKISRINEKNPKSQISFIEKPISMNRNPSNENSPHSKSQGMIGFSDCISCLMFKLQTDLLEIRKKIILYKLNERGNNVFNNFYELNKQKYEKKVLYKEFSYYYFNSVRLQNSYNDNKNFFSYIGFILIKDPEQVLEAEPDNFKKPYDLF